MSIIDYKKNPNREEITEAQKRWLSWNYLVRDRKKTSYSGTVPKKEIEKRRKANKVAKASRKRNR